MSGFHVLFFHIYFAVNSLESRFTRVVALHERQETSPHALCSTYQKQNSRRTTAVDTLTQPSHRLRLQWHERQHSHKPCAGTVYLPCLVAEGGGIVQHHRQLCLLVDYYCRIHIELTLEGNIRNDDKTNKHKHLIGYVDAFPARGRDMQTTQGLQQGCHPEQKKPQPCTGTAVFPEHVTTAVATKYFRDPVTAAWPSFKKRHAYNTTVPLQYRGAVIRRRLRHMFTPQYMRTAVITAAGARYFENLCKNQKT